MNENSSFSLRLRRYREGCAKPELDKSMTTGPSMVETILALLEQDLPLDLIYIDPQRVTVHFAGGYLTAEKI